MVAQDPRFEPETTVREVIAASAREGEDKDLEVSKIISRTGFEDPSATGGNALRRLAEAAGDRRRPGATARCAAA